MRLEKEHTSGKLALAFQVSRQRPVKKGRRIRLEGVWWIQSSCLSGRPRASLFRSQCKEFGPWRHAAGFELAS